MEASALSCSSTTVWRYRIARAIRSGATARGVRSIRRDRRWISVRRDLAWQVPAISSGVQLPVCIQPAGMEYHPEYRVRPLGRPDKDLDQVEDDQRRADSISMGAGDDRGTGKAQVCAVSCRHRYRQICIRKSLPPAPTHPEPTPSSRPAKRPAQNNSLRVTFTGRNDRHLRQGGR